MLGRFDGCAKAARGLHRERRLPTPKYAGLQTLWGQQEWEAEIWPTWGPSICKQPQWLLFWPADCRAQGIAADPNSSSSLNKFGHGVFALWEGLQRRVQNLLQRCYCLSSCRFFVFLEVADSFSQMSWGVEERHHAISYYWKNTWCYLELKQRLWANWISLTAKMFTFWIYSLFILHTSCSGSWWFKHMLRWCYKYMLKEHLLRHCFHN